LSHIILRGINRSNYDDSKPYLEAMTYLLNISDFLQMKRIEWILGYPQPLAFSIQNESDSYGMYGNSSLADVVVNYESPLNIQNSTSIINLMLSNRRRLENLCILCLK